MRLSVDSGEMSRWRINFLDLFPFFLFFGSRFLKIWTNLTCQVIQTRAKFCLKLCSNIWQCQPRFSVAFEKRFRDSTQLQCNCDKGF